MSTEPNATPPASPDPAPPVKAAARPQGKTSLWRTLFLGQTKLGELAVYHHSNLFYWWPVWLFGYVMAAFTYFGDMRLAVVPAGTEALEKRVVILTEKFEDHVKRDVLVLPEKGHLPTTVDADGNTVIMQPTFYASERKGIGTFFMIVLLLVIIITNVTLRGLWSVLVLVVLVLLSILFWAAGWWEGILARFGQLAVYINLGGYLLLSSVLLFFWLINFFIFDRQTYMIFTPGQVRLCLEIGGGETVYDTTGMVVVKQRGDLFRHWGLGFGSGDLVIRPVGVANPIELTNVLRVGRVVRAIELMIKEKVIISETK